MRLSSSLQALQSMFRWGVTPSLDPRLAKRIVLANQISAFYTLTVLVFIALFFFLGLESALLVSIPFLLMEMVWPFFNRIGWYNFSRVGLMVASNLFGFTLCIVLGPETRFNQGFFVMACQPLALFGLKDRGYLLFGIILAVGLYLVSEWARFDFGVALAPQTRSLIHGVTAPLYLVLVYLIVLYFSSANESSEQKLMQSVLELRRAKEATESLHKKLVTASRQAGMAEVAAGILHNVGNVLNSVNVTTTLMAQRVDRLRVPALEKGVGLIKDNRPNASEFFGPGGKGGDAIAYLEALSAHFTENQKAMAQDLKSLAGHVDHIKSVIAVQQSLAKRSNVSEPIALAAVIDEALQVSMVTRDAEISVDREIEPLPEVQTDRHKVLQILINLISNARHALHASGAPSKRLLLKAAKAGDRAIRIEVVDNGVGIARENLTRVFSYGFTTKKDGHGFGLHSSSLAASELGGSLRAVSEGPGAGASFVLELPIDPARPTEPKP
jgi:signal transduction histidine kinase